MNMWMTDEQYKESLWAIRVDDQLLGQIDDAVNHYAALRAKVEVLENIQAIDLKNNNEYREQVATLKASLAACDQEREEIAARWKEEFELRCNLEDKLAKGGFMNKWIA